jgi:hypothetical protein
MSFREYASYIAKLKPYFDSLWEIAFSEKKVFLLIPVVILILTITIIYWYVRFEKATKRKNIIRFFASLWIVVVSFLKNIMAIIFLIVILVAVVEISAAIDRVYEKIELVEQIKQLEIAISNLSSDYTIGKMNVKKVDCAYVRVPECYYELSFKFYAPPDSNNPENEHVVKEFEKDYIKEVTIKDGFPRIKYKVMLFNYSVLQNVSNKNIVIPVGVFSDTIPSEDAKKFGLTENCNSLNEIPIPLYENKDMIEGMGKERYRQAMGKFCEILKDESKMKKYGIRRVDDNSARGRRLQKEDEGKTFYLKVNKDGMTIEYP